MLWDEEKGNIAGLENQKAILYTWCVLYRTQKRSQSYKARMLIKQKEKADMVMK